MRTLRLTNEETSLILWALGISEMKFNELRKNYIEQVVNIRGIENKTEAIAEADMLFTKENEFCDLLMSLKNGEKDA